MFRCNSRQNYFNSPKREEDSYINVVVSALKKQQSNSTCIPVRPPDIVIYNGRTSYWSVK
jgi:hypothetical protein